MLDRHLNNCECLSVLSADSLFISAFLNLSVLLFCQRVIECYCRDLKNSLPQRTDTRRRVKGGRVDEKSCGKRGRVDKLQWCGED